MRVVIIGGHLSPAFSVIEKLRNEEILFVGRKHALGDDSALSLEYRLCQDLKIPFKSIKTAKLVRRPSLRTVFSFFNLPVGTIQSVLILKKFKPDVILGFGGYVSLPVVFAGKILKVPIVIHEQTLEAGVANKILAKVADKICISWASSEQFFPKAKTILTGNPLREKLLNPKKDEALFLDFKNKNLPLIYITGGSLGAHAINVLVEQALPKLLKISNVIHQTGDSKKYADFARLLEKRSEGYMVEKFFSVEKLSAIYEAADLVISRAGINTLTELIYFNKPSLLIPLLIGQKNEQLKNAQFCKNLGLSEIYTQGGLNFEKFLKIIKYMLANLAKYKENKKVKQLISQDAADKIIRVLKNVARQKST